MKNECFAKLQQVRKEIHEFNREKFVILFKNEATTSDVEKKSKQTRKQIKWEA